MIRRAVFTVLGGATALFGLGASASADTQSYIDLQAGLGYSTNPLLRLGSGTGSAFGRISAYGFQGWTTEKGSTNLSAYVEDSSYFSHYSSQQVFDLAAATTQSVSEKVRLFGNIDFSEDISGQLASRFYGVPPGSVIVDPTVPSDIVSGSPDLFAINRRQYQLSGQVGTSITLSPRDSLSAAVGGRRVLISDPTSDLDYTAYDGSLQYDRQVNERVTVGGRLTGKYTKYDSGGTITSFGPEATVRASLSADWTASAAVGLQSTRKEGGLVGSDHTSVDLQFDGSLCRDRQNEKICVRASRSRQSTILQDAVSSTAASADYYRRLTANSWIQATASVVRSSNYRILGVDQPSTFYTFAGSYNRKLNDRLSAGVNVTARKFAAYGPDPKEDFGGYLFIGYRIGDVR